MAAEPEHRQTTTLTVRGDQMLFAIPVDDDGIEETLFTTDDTRSMDEEQVEFAGMWNHLNWDDAQAFFDQLDRDGMPSAPLQASDF